MKKQEGIAMPSSLLRLAVSIVLGGALAASLAAEPRPVAVRKDGNGAPMVLVSGTVTDGSGHGWPLYARLEITSATTEPLVVYSDPVTGAYAANVPDATAYTFAVTAVSAGYAAGGGAVATAGSPVVANWVLEAGALCNAPGYDVGTYGPPVLSESFDAGVLPPGWSVQTTTGASWSIATGGDPCGEFSGNRTGGSGPYALVNSNCDTNFFDPEDTYLITPGFDLSSASNAAIQWANDFVNDGVTAIAEVDASTDGGVNWTNVWHEESTLVGPGTVIADMSFAAGHAGVSARFHYNGFWGWWWQVDDVMVGPFSCATPQGGLLVGNVRDANTGAGLNGATVTDLHTGGTFATTGPSPDQGDGFYTLFAEGSGAQTFLAGAPLHTGMSEDTTIVPNATVRLDFSLPAGLLDASPRPLSAIVNPGDSTSLTLDVSNSGTGDGTFFLHEVNVPPPPPAAATRTPAAAKRPALRRYYDLASRGARARVPVLPGAPTNTPLAAGAGNVVGTFSTGFSGGYGMAYDTDTNRLWICNSDAPPAGLTGDGLDHEFQPDGTPTGATIDLQGAPSTWQGDGTYDARTGMIWQTGVAFRVGDPNQCLFEIDPSAGVVTGKTICGPWSNYPGLTGLAYDYATDTFYVGDQLGSITHVDLAGNVLDSGYIGLQISGLAFNPTTRILYVGTFSNIPYDIWLVDPSHGYSVLSGFSVKSNGVPVLNGNGVSLEADCLGHLWVYDIAQASVFEVESGSQGWCVDEIPWLSEDPAAATVPGSGVGAGAANTVPVTVTFDSTGLAPGLRLRSLVFTSNTPTPVAPVPVDFTVLFNDVPSGSFAWNYIYGAAGAGVMPGCAPQAPLFDFCPGQAVTRRSMAGYIETAVHGALTPPPVYRAEFDDVLLGSFNADYIQGLLDDRITAGCSVSPALYCPDVPVTRAQMAVFVWKGQHGDEAPPPCTPPGTFADVPCPGGFAVDYVEGIYAEGITAGCGNGNYCPNAAITNAQMAVYLVKAFAIPYLP
ncbi:MAG TPA: S-layer homology domain-containing protein [Thermoanaerobaculia bacterium]|nr:S-layer homology domain-containing protein [Thermoanaerobaculia bacterium]